jgi:hypothetical protein
MVSLHFTSKIEVNLFIYLIGDRERLSIFFRWTSVDSMSKELVFSTAWIA